jgi:RimJ/RimL family protein N-acetyltransferase
VIPFLETARLSLREFHADDADNLYRLDRNPCVMRYIGDGSVATRASVTAALERAAKHYRNYPGLGVWPAEERTSGEFVGWFCLKYVRGQTTFSGNVGGTASSAGETWSDPTVEVELGYRLLPDAWGYGYATEGAQALVRYGFETLGLYRIIGLTHPGNMASQRVLRKAGLRDAGWGRYYDGDLRLFIAEAS